jgi:hypothetical protein
MFGGGGNGNDGNDGGSNRREDNGNCNLLDKKNESSL